MRPHGLNRKVGESSVHRKLSGNLFARQIRTRLGSPRDFHAKAYTPHGPDRDPLLALIDTAVTIHANSVFQSSIALGVIDQ